MSPTIFITGATGNTGKALSELLFAAGKKDDISLAYREGGTVPDKKFPNTVKFDWTKPATFVNPFPAGHTIKTVYLLFPITFYDTLTISKAFLDKAKAEKVTRFVLLSGTPMIYGSAPIGDVHKYIKETLNTDYFILRPTGFFTLLREPPFLASIRDYNYLASATKNGRIALVSVDDIADVAYEAVTAPGPVKTERVILGPELFSYDEAAALLASKDVLDRNVFHSKLTDQQALNLYKSVYPDKTGKFDLAIFWKGTDDFQARGEEEKFFFSKGRVIGYRRLKDYLVTNKAVWTPPQ
ncbi:hypothetical protein H0H87_002346 [Tephrocybe sp. NHM501043]|nr:hypothetical protein H0H87_002346 [Tephrocybe sp. NHM501043]